MSMADNLRRLPFDNTHAKIINGIEHLYAFARHLDSFGQIGSIFAPLSLLRISMEAFAYLEWLNDPNMSAKLYYSLGTWQNRKTQLGRNAAIGCVLAKEFSDSETTKMRTEAAEQLANDCKRLIARGGIPKYCLGDQTHHAKTRREELNTSTVQKAIDKSNPEFGSMSELPYKRIEWDCAC